MAAPQGLVVPVIHDADRLSVAGIAAAARDLTQRARQNKLTLSDVEGGTFTLNNTGALGSTTSYPIITIRKPPYSLPRRFKSGQWCGMTPLPSVP